MTEQVAKLNAQFPQFRARARSQQPARSSSSLPISDANLPQITDAVWRMMVEAIAGLDARLPPVPIVRPLLAVARVVKIAALPTPLSASLKLVSVSGSANINT
ncbi:unnamed protein product [Arctia plantaginis]|uniref:Uncharacterized protein n=1 Tax=Arctia plantaginis TaxID=874455 RepID=A0A8S0ZQI1_ARCPL|nr:unnamed protein product [Arctia plantaginis]